MVLRFAILVLLGSFGTAGASERQFRGDSYEPVPIIQSTGAAQRLGAAVELRSLFATLPAEACMLHNGEDASRRALELALKRVDRLTFALREGNPFMDIMGAEADRQALAQLDSLENRWPRLRVALEWLLDTPDDRAALEGIIAAFGALEGHADQLVSEILNIYSNPVELTLREALHIDLAGRQQALLNEVAHGGCIGTMSPEAVSQVELGLNALVQGMPEVGIRPASNPQIVEQLELVQQAWTQARAQWDGQSPDFNTSLGQARDAMAEATALYVKHAKYAF